jgi:hypothetical protein
MSSTRASIFSSDEDLDLSDFTPKTAPDPTAPSQEQVRAVAEKASFRSREPQPPVTIPAAAQPVAQRRHRTGRNVQCNIKAKAETVAAFKALSDENGWVDGETFERAIAALKREMAKAG